LYHAVSARRADVGPQQPVAQERPAGMVGASANHAALLQFNR